MADHADDCAAVIDAFCDGAAVVCGLSLGGLVTQQTAINCPDKVRLAIPMDTSAYIGGATISDRHFRPPGTDMAARQPKAEWLRAVAQKLAGEEGRALHKLRQQTVEPVFAIIKAVLGFRRFSMRGLDKVAGERDLVALACNCKRLHKLKLGMAS